MPDHECEVPFESVETWRRWNFFPSEGEIASEPEVKGHKSNGVPAAKTVEAIRTTVQNGWGGDQEVVQLHVVLE